MIIAAMLVSCVILVGISYLMLDILSGIVVTPKTPVREVANRGELVIPVPGKEISSMQVSGDGRFFAYTQKGEGKDGCELHVIEMDEDRSMLFTQDVRDGSLAWLGESGSLVYEDGGDIFRLDVEEGTQVNLTGSEEYDSSPLPSPDGEYILWTRSPLDVGPGEPEFWVMGSDGSDQVILAPWSRLPAWDPDGGKVISCRQAALSSEDQTQRFYLLTAEPGSGEWDLYTECEGEASFLWWPRREEIFYISPRLTGEQDGIKGVLSKIDIGDPFKQKQVASSDGLGDINAYYRCYPSREDERLAYIGEKGLECLKVEERVIDRFTALEPDVPLAWNEVMNEIYYCGPDGIYKVSL